MNVDSRLGSIWDEADRFSAFSGSGRRNSASAAREVPATVDDALDLVNAAKESAYQSTMKTWDKHTDMVEKSQQLRQVRDRKEAMERLNKERREENTELMAQIAIENANRSKMLEARALERKAMDLALVA